MTEQELFEYEDKTVRVQCASGNIVKGYCDCVVRAIDNEPEEAEIDIKTPIGYVAIMQSEIVSIEIVK